ncbi:hypothetical protein B0H11DRAFT_2289688 [Mycena galericulata]|nr:hypothetical protein B0H11DRAFT_2289688 [Mycena galericulata]
MAVPPPERLAQSFLNIYTTPEATTGLWDQFNNSRNARAYPDLAENGANFVVGVNHEFGLVYGTSASTPTTASMFTMINDVRLAVGMKPVGFVNPAIYSEAFRIGFNDITIGGNQGCGMHYFLGFTSV